MAIHFLLRFPNEPADDCDPVNEFRYRALNDMGCLQQMRIAVAKIRIF
jgi:hypothetical protein